LSDSVALLCTVLTLRLGEVFMRRGTVGAAIGCGIAAGLGYLTRPEVVLVPLAILLAAMTWFIPCAASIGLRSRLPRLAAMTLAFLALVGTYTLVKGEVSEKLSMRTAVGLQPSAPPRTDSAKSRPSWPPGLDDPALDFSAKEESEEGSLQGTGGSAL